MSPMRISFFDGQWVRLVSSAIVGVAAGFVGATLGHPAWGPVLGWVAAATTFCAWTWLRVARLDADDSRTHATREDPGRGVGDVVLVLSSLGAVVGVGLLLGANRQHGHGDAEAIIGVLGVVASWFTVHTLFTLRYARLYHESGGAGIDFGGDVPAYTDFAYLAFTIGMTYQVSDTTLERADIRRTALRHALLSFFLGAVVLAVTINLVVQLAAAG